MRAGMFYLNEKPTDYPDHNGKRRANPKGGKPPTQSTDDDGCQYYTPSNYNFTDGVGWGVESLHAVADDDPELYHQGYMVGWQDGYVAGISDGCTAYDQERGEGEDVVVGRGRSRGSKKTKKNVKMRAGMFSCCRGNKTPPEEEVVDDAPPTYDVTQNPSHVNGYQMGYSGVVDDAPPTYDVTQNPSHVNGYQMGYSRGYDIGYDEGRAKGFDPKRNEMVPVSSVKRVKSIKRQGPSGKRNHRIYGGTLTREKTIRISGT